MLQVNCSIGSGKKNPVYGRFSKDGRNEASGKFSYLILNHLNDCQPLQTAQGEGVSASDAMIQRLTPQKYCSIFKNKVHVAASLRLCTVKFYLFWIQLAIEAAQIIIIGFKFKLGLATAQSCGYSSQLHDRVSQVIS